MTTRKGTRPPRRLPRRVKPRSGLQAVIERLSRSARYQLLQHLPLTGLGKEAVFHHAALLHLRLSDLVEQGLSSVTPLSRSERRELTEALTRLLPDEEPAQVIPLSNRQRRGGTEVLSSVDAERRLVECFARLRASPRFHLLQHGRVGDFWDPAWARAPFEESLTLRQLCDLRVSVLLEKRSFGTEKILNVIRAIDRALESEPPADSNSAPRATSPGQAPIEEKPHWCGLEQPEAKAAVPIVNWIEAEWLRAGVSSSPLALLLRALPFALSRRETAMLWLAQDSDEFGVAAVIREDPAVVRDVLRASLMKLAALGAQVVPLLGSALELALAAPAVPFLHLVEPFRDESFDATLQDGLVRMLIAAHGARHPVVFGEPISRWWTCQPEALELVLVGLLAGLPRADAELRRQTGAILPRLNPEEVLELLKGRAILRPHDQCWVRREDCSRMS